MKRKTLFISKATPEDDEFVLWLAPRLEAEGYTVFADIMNLVAGDRWRKQVTDTLQNHAVKMLLCCRDSTLAKNGVQEEMGMAEDLVKGLDDARFIIPLRLEPYKKVFGIGELQYVDFVGSWASGLRDLLETLSIQSVPRASEITINPSWESYKKRLALKVENSPETLTSNWLRIVMPDDIRYYSPPNPINLWLMETACDACPFPAVTHSRGFFSFALPAEVDAAFAGVGEFEVRSEPKLGEFLDKGSESPAVESREAKNIVLSMFRMAFENCCRAKGMQEYAFSSQSGFHFTRDHIPLGKKVPWSQTGTRRLSMLRNIAGGKVWQYGISITPHLWPFPHFRVKSRVLFAEISGQEAGSVIDDRDQQHRLRRRICKGWRNKAWHGKLMASLELLSGESSELRLPLSGCCILKVDAQPIVVTAPVTTTSPDVMEDDSEEQDPSTFGQFDGQDDEE